MSYIIEMVTDTWTHMIVLFFFAIVIFLFILCNSEQTCFLHHTEALRQFLTTSCTELFVMSLPVNSICHLWAPLRPGRFTELLKPDLEPWKVDNTSVARLPPVPTAGTKASVSWGLSVCRRFDNVLSESSRTTGQWRREKVERGGGGGRGGGGARGRGGG